MELNVYNVILSDGTEVSLRLTSKAIGAYLKTYGEPGQLPLAVLMRATEEYEPRAALLNGAMKYPGNPNTVKTGEELLDLLSIDGRTWDDVNTLIIQILRDAGFVDDKSQKTLVESLKLNSARVIGQLQSILSGEAPETVQEAAGAPEPENPTNTRRT